MDVLTYLQGKGSHSIDVLLAIFHITAAKREARRTGAETTVRWKEVKDYICSQGKSISDGTYRGRRDELLEMGLLELQPLDDMRADVKMTEKGMTIASIVNEFMEKLNNAYGIESEK
jgi:hypothetical protein